ncbi:MAG: hypothetical protein GDA53_10350 [Rhodobacteraceae bacterium]|nr:hypothetical protein [Paracoccaceae bacterium]
MTTKTDQIINALCKEIANGKLRDPLSEIIADILKGDDAAHTPPAGVGPQPRLETRPGLGFGGYGGQSATPTQEITEEQADLLAEGIVDALNDHERKELKRFINVGGAGLPRELDIHMLRVFKNTYRRFATENEKSSIRKAIAVKGRA